MLSKIHVRQSFLSSLYKHFFQKAPYIIINVNSYGGDVRALVLMVSAIKRAKYFGKIIVTFCAGYAMSCGSVLMALGTNGYRYGTLDCCILMHQIRSGCRGPLATQEMELLESESLNTKIFVWMAENAGLADVEYYAKLVDNAKVDLYFTAKQAKELRLIDHIGYPRFVHKVSQDYFIVPVQEENSHDQNIINTILDKVHKFKDIIPPALKPQSTPTNKSSSAAVTVDRADTQLPISEFYRDMQYTDYL